MNELKPKMAQSLRRFYGHRNIPSTYLSKVSIHRCIHPRDVFVSNAMKDQCHQILV